MSSPPRRLLLTALLATIVAVACTDVTEQPASKHGAIAPGISAPLGEPLPSASAEQLATFERGAEIAVRRFDRSTGLGPAFNVAFCAACHERPVTGGSAGLYRNFAIAGTILSDGSLVPTQSAGDAAGVVRLYYRGTDGPARPAVDASVNTVAQRNPIPFFGVGLLAEIEDEEILSREDPDDADGDGISGRANFDRGFVGRFGRKAQTVSIEGFIRGPLFNHAGITTNPLTNEERAKLPVDSSVTTTARFAPVVEPLRMLAQAAAPSSPVVDDDGIPDPELASEDLFDLISFAMLLAAPEIEPEVGEAARGRQVFDDVGCASCHTPRLMGPRGPLPVYSDLLLHDMGPELADGTAPGLATGSEFRTQPLWGIGPVGPYLHDGRAQTLEAAILMHAGEAKDSRDRAAALDEADMEALVEFLLSLGGRAQTTPGLLPPGAEVPETGTYGGPVTGLTEDEKRRFALGRELFDRDFGFDDGVGEPRFNGDSCRACHFEPVIGGAGPLGVNVMRHGITNSAGEFAPPGVGTILHRETALFDTAIVAQPEATIFEARQTPHLFGLGLIEGISEEVIEAGADPDDSLVPDGISGRIARTDGGRLGRFGWKAQVPTVAEFVRDAIGAELGMTLPDVPGHTFGILKDNDDVPDPELSADDAALIAFYLQKLGPPPRQGDPTAPEVVAGAELFESTGCAACHTPSLDGVPLYSDLLLHEILPPGSPGIEDGSAGVLEFRTPPLWGIATTAPYMHDGSADTFVEAIVAHDGEGAASRDAFDGLSAEEKAALLEFLGTL